MLKKVNDEKLSVISFFSSFLWLTKGSISDQIYLKFKKSSNKLRCGARSRIFYSLCQLKAVKAGLILLNSTPSTNIPFSCDKDKRVMHFTNLHRYSTKVYMHMQLSFMCITDQEMELFVFLITAI